jgi:hypothetical protein
MAQQCDEWWVACRDTWVAAKNARLTAEAAQTAAAATTVSDDPGSHNVILMALAARAPAMSRSSSGAAATGSDAPPSAHAVLEIVDSDADADADTTADSIPVSPAKRSAPRAFPEVVIPKVRVKKEKDAEPERPKAKGKKPEFDGPVHALLPACTSAAHFLIGSQS